MNAAPPNTKESQRRAETLSQLNVAYTTKVFNQAPHDVTASSRFLMLLQKTAPPLPPYNPPLD